MSWDIELSTMDEKILSSQSQVLSATKKKAIDMSSQRRPNNKIDVSASAAMPPLFAVCRYIPPKK